MGPKRRLLVLTSCCRGRWRSIGPTSHPPGWNLERVVDTAFSSSYRGPICENWAWSDRPVWCDSVQAAPQVGQVPAKWPWLGLQVLSLWLPWGRLWAVHAFSRSAWTSWSEASTWHPFWTFAKQETCRAFVREGMRIALTRIFQHSSTADSQSASDRVWIDLRRLRPYQAMFCRIAGKSWVRGISWAHRLKAASSLGSLATPVCYTPKSGAGKCLPLFPP